MSLITMLLEIDSMQCEKSNAELSVSIGSQYVDAYTLSRRAGTANVYEATGLFSFLITRSSLYSLSSPSLIILHHLLF